VSDEEPQTISEDHLAHRPEDEPSLDAAELEALVEALVFASDRPITVHRLCELTRGDRASVEAALAALAERYSGRGIALQEISGGFILRTDARYAPFVSELVAGRPVRLSRAQLETLAIIAYRQPITRPEIDDIRGVDSSGTLRVLLERNLIRVLGKKEEVGRPLIYGTTKEFLDFFSLADLRELPTLREFAELSDENRAVVDQLIVPAADGAAEPAAADGAPEPPDDDSPGSDPEA
jgi:segregation and condensation protein B